MLTNPAANLSTVNYLTLAANGVGASFTDNTVTHRTYTSPSYAGYLMGNPADAFVNGNLTATPTFTDFSDTTMVLESGVLPTLPPGASETYQFYYTFDTPNPVTSSTPEPGTLSLLLGGMVSAGGMALRSRRRRK